MYKFRKPSRTTIKKFYVTEGETLEQKIERILENQEGIKDGAPLIYTDRSDGIVPEFDIRTDRWDVAIHGMDAVTKSKRAKREANAQIKLNDTDRTPKGADEGAKTPQGGGDSATSN